ncbi:MAG: hypothetical protein ABEI86_04170, partial [Halobacteriaceae archaeon]
MDLKRTRSYLKENPIAYAGLRALDVSNQGREQTVAEKDEIPYIFSVAFLPLIISYSIWKRLVFLGQGILSLETTRLSSIPDHIFVMTSTHKYRTYTFEKVGNRLLEENQEVLFLCSPEAAARMEDWHKMGFQTESFRNMLRFVSLLELFTNVIRSIIATYILRRTIDDEFESFPKLYVFNSILLEYIKFSSIKQIVGKNPAVHTYSLMPYQVQATVPRRLYVYQHGVQFTPDNDAWAAISFFPANILVWGNAWIENFEKLVHPESVLHVTGSPWHDYLSESEKECSAEWDLLFISGSQVTTHSEERERLFEELVANLIQGSENNEWDLAIKLHPAEDIEWYRSNDWDDYVVEFDSIRDALACTDVAVTHFSSAFVESIALGTPIILGEEWVQGLNGIRPISGASVVETNNIVNEIKRLRESGHES